MADSGHNKMKVCLSIIPFEEQGLQKHRATYAEGGVLSKHSLDSGVNKVIMCFCALNIIEVFENLKKIFECLQLEKVFKNYKNVILTGGLKIINEVYGSMEGSAKHPCVYCTSCAQNLEAGTRRTLKNIKFDNELWIKSGANKNNCKNFNNI